MRSSGLRARALTIVGALVVTGCPDESPSDATNAPGVVAKRENLAPASPYGPKPTNRFGRVLSLLVQEPQAKARAALLYPEVDPICADVKVRRKFIADAAAYVNVRDRPADRGWAKRKSIDVIEYVATSCFRNTPPASFAILDDARKLFPDSYRFDVVAARLRLAAGELPPALEAAQRAKAAGSVHAIALTALVEARIARAKQPGYRAGMLDPALTTVGVEPDGGWPLIDLTAVLMTRASLLEEKAIWETGEIRQAALRDARKAFIRLAKDPFLETTRRFATDAGCFDAVALGEDPAAFCSRAAVDFSVIGAAQLAGVPPTKDFDAARMRALFGARDAIDKLAEGATVVVVARGSESELHAWARPAAQVLARIALRKPSFVVVNRTTGSRGAALLDRVIELAGAKPTVRVDAGRNTLAMPCVAAVVAGRTTPKACPIDPAVVTRLTKLPKFGYAVLFGRDLDAEIDDLQLYELPHLLLSVRLPLTDDRPAAHAKSLSDAWLFAPNADALVGKFKSDD